MSTKEISWAPSNRWFKAGFDAAQIIELEDVKIKIMSVSYFLATKFEAFHNRGKSDPFGSPDFEDIVYILDNNADFIKELNNVPDDVKRYLELEFERLLYDKTLNEAILGNLDHVTQTKRFELILNKIKSTLSN
jgi:predicted nucleotidyltransferase